MRLKSILSLSLVAFAFPVSLWAEDAHHPKAADAATQETAPAPAETIGMITRPLVPNLRQGGVELIRRQGS